MLKTMTNKGFTLIEMVLVIIIIGVLSISIAPKFLTSGGYEEFTIQAQSIAALRAIQLRALQQTDGTCHQVLVTPTKIGKPDTNECESNAEFSTSWKPSATGLEIESGSGFSFDVSNSGFAFEFDSYGRPSCGVNCDITILGGQTLIVGIESEGYVHAD